MSHSGRRTRPASKCEYDFGDPLLAPDLLCVEIGRHGWVPPIEPKEQNRNEGNNGGGMRNVMQNQPQLCSGYGRKHEPNNLPVISPHYGPFRIVQYGFMFGLSGPLVAALFLPHKLSKSVVTQQQTRLASPFEGSYNTPKLLFPAGGGQPTFLE